MVAPKSCASADDILAVYDLFAMRAVAEFNDQGEVPFQLYAVVLEDGGTAGKIAGLLVPAPEVLAELFDADGRDKVVTVARLFLQDNSPLRAEMADDGTPLPCLMVQVCEGWETVVRTETGTPQAGPRGACIIIAVHTKDNSHVGACPIRGGSQPQAQFRALQLGAIGDVLGRQSMAQNGTLMTNSSQSRH
jgi:hypothetical protein